MFSSETTIVLVITIRKVIYIFIKFIFEFDIKIEIMVQQSHRFSDRDSIDYRNILSFVLLYVFSNVNVFIIAKYSLYHKMCFYLWSFILNLFLLIWFIFVGQYVLNIKYKYS